MVFSGLPFLYYFLPAVLLAYYAVPGRFKNAVLLAASLGFYAWGEGLLVVLFAGCIAVNWALALALASRRRRSLLVAALALDLGLLGWFKYADFFLENLSAVPGIAVPALGIALPIGISFYTFQLVSYTVDVWRGEVAPQRSLIDFAAYVAMFPQLIAGPIVRYCEVSERLRCRSHTADGIAAGVVRFLSGLGKKVLLANVLGEVCTAFHATAEPSVLYHWLYALSYALQIYFDFSGYSDMAIGLGRLFGFEFPENFCYPYISASITEFWRRWHISLGSWFRDYVYIPLGGSRRGIRRQLCCIAVVWMLTGLWHGAAWNFVLWGVWFAILLSAEKLGLRSRLEAHPVAAHIYTMLAVLFGFVLFDAGSLYEAGRNLAGLFGGFGALPLKSPEAVYMLRSYGPVLAAAAFGATPGPKRLAERFRLLSRLEPLGLAVLLAVVTAYLADGSFNPFLYFRF